jgi:hypothetical protein
MLLIFIDRISCRRNAGAASHAKSDSRHAIFVDDLASSVSDHTMGVVGHPLSVNGHALGIVGQNSWRARPRTERG